MPDLAQLERDLDALEQDEALYDDDSRLFRAETPCNNLAARFQALKTLDFLEEAIQSRLFRAEAHCNTTRSHHHPTIHLQRILSLRADLEQRNDSLYQKLRSGIQSGTGTPRQLRTLLENNCRYRSGDVACLHWGAEAADELAARLFHSDCLPGPWSATDAEMIHYESTPVSALLELVDRVPLTAEDRFIDIGSGLGQVAMLIHLLTGVDAVGLEVMSAFVEHAAREAATLGIHGVTFRQGDARTADLCAGTVYFLFTPFRGRMLQTVLTRLRREARARPLTVCSFGPCTEQIATKEWLTLQEPQMNHEFRLAIFRSL